VETISTDQAIESLNFEGVDQLESQVKLVVQTMVGLTEENKLQQAEIKLLRKKLEELGNHKNTDNSEELEAFRSENQRLKEKLEHVETRIKEMLTRLDFIEAG